MGINRAKRFLIAVRNVSLWALALVACRGSYELIVRFGSLDPFAKYRSGGMNGLSDQLGIQLHGVHLKAFHLATLTTDAFVDRVDVRKDRQTLDLVAVHDGVYRGMPGGPVRFEASHGQWLALDERLVVSGLARVRSRDLDLRTSIATLDRRLRRLEITTPVEGTLGGGRIKAQNVTYNFDNGSFAARKIDWTGSVKLLQEAGGDKAPRQWHVVAEDETGDKLVQDAINAVATDGDVIVRAPKLHRVIKTDVVTATGGITYFSSKANMIADKVVIYRKEKRAVFSGHVTMLVKPKKDADKKTVEVPIPPFRPLVPDEVKATRPKAPGTPSEEEKKRNEDIRSGKTVRDLPIALSADQITYWYEKGSRRAKVEGNPQGHQEFPGGGWRHVWAYVAYYDAEKETLRLESSPGQKKKNYETRMKNSIGDDMTAQWLVISTKDDNDDEKEHQSHDTSGVFADPDEEIPTDNKPGGSPTTPPQAPPNQKPPQ